MEILLESLLFAGIDMGKDSFVACQIESDVSKPRTRKFKNDEAGIAELIVWLAPHGRPCRVLMEATSRYHRQCERLLLAAGITVELLNPRRARALAQGLGFSDKDDKVDALALAQSARVLQASNEKMASLQAQDLKDHSRTIDTIKREAAKFSKRMDGLEPDSAAFKACAKAVVALKGLAAKEEKIWLKDVQNEPEIQRRYKLAISVPDVGHVTARTVAVELPANLDKSARSLIAYSGLVPRRHQSGNHELPPQIYGGNPWLRTGVFMAAMHSVYHGKRYLPWYEALKSRPNVCVKTKGGRHLKAIVAVMRKILANVIAVIKRNAPWSQEAPEYHAVTAAKPEAP